MSIRVKEYKFFRSLSVKVNDNWPVRKAEQLWRQMRANKIAGWRINTLLTSFSFHRLIILPRFIPIYIISLNIHFI